MTHALSTLESILLCGRGVRDAAGNLRPLATGDEEPTCQQCRDASRRRKEAEAVSRSLRDPELALSRALAAYNALVNGPSPRLADLDQAHEVVRGAVKSVKMFRKIEARRGAEPKGLTRKVKR